MVRSQDTAQDGEVVVALLGEEATVKRFFREADHVRLQPENDAMEPIRTREVRILGPGMLPRAIASRSSASDAEPGLCTVVNPAWRVVHAFPAAARADSAEVSPSESVWVCPSLLKCQPM